MRDISTSRDETPTQSSQGAAPGKGITGRLPRMHFRFGHRFRADVAVVPSVGTANSRAVRCFDLE